MHDLVSLGTNSAQRTMAHGAFSMKMVAIILLASICATLAASISSVVRKESVNEDDHTLSLLQLDSRGVMKARGRLASNIINGTLVRNASSKYSFFAMPTSGKDTDDWLGCGASIISPTYGLTAQHCFGGGNTPCAGPKELALWVGDIFLSPTGELSPKSGGKHARVKAEAICHPKFDGKCSHGHDMVLLKLKDPLPPWVVPVKLDIAGDSESSAVGQITNNIGFGLREDPHDRTLISGTTPDSMREAELTIQPDDLQACAAVYAGGFGCSDAASEGSVENQHTQLCAGATDDPPRDTCSGDSGSPMLDKDGMQIGIVSYGGGPDHGGQIMRGPGRICADPAYMGVYTRVSAMKDWIKSHVTDLPYSGP